MPFKIERYESSMNLASRAIIQEKQIDNVPYSSLVHITGHKTEKNSINSSINYSNDGSFNIEIIQKDKALSAR